MSNQDFIVTETGSGTPYISMPDSWSFAGQDLFRVQLNFSPSDKWQGVRSIPSSPAAISGPAAISFDFIYRRRQTPADAGQPFYAELAEDSQILDAYWLEDSVAEDSPYVKNKVTLYTRSAVDPSKLAVNLYIGKPYSEYKGHIWFSGWSVESVTHDAFPPELAASPAAPPKPFKCGAVSVSPIDPELIPAAINALGYLKGAADSGKILYGVQNFPYEKGGLGYKDAPADTSDVYDLTGTIPAIFGVDSLSLIGMEDAFRMPGINLVSDDLSDPENIPLFIRGSVMRSIEAWNSGSLTTLSLHMSDPGMVYDQYVKDNKNPVSGRAIYNGGEKYPWNFYGYGYANSTRAASDAHDGRARSSHKTMLRLYRALNGSGDSCDTGALDVLNAYLDISADFCLALQRENIPVLYRPYHENSGDWFWWGNSGCENDDGSYNPDIFKIVWRHTVEYMLKRGVHNCIYVYSPNGADFDNEEKLGTSQFRPYVITYPGDQWVDICAFDDYTSDEAAMRGDIETVTRFAAEHGKLAAASEVTGSPDDPAITEYIFRTLTDTAHLPCNLAYLLQWTPPSFSPFLVSPTRTNSTAGGAYISALSSDRVIMANETCGFAPEK